MSNRQRRARETLEIYLVHLILAYRPLIFIVGLLLLACAVISMFIYPLASYLILLPAICLILLGSLFDVVHFTARLGAWLGTWGRHTD